MEESKMGRPTVKTPQLVQEILDLIVMGYNMDGITSQKGMPDRATIYRWLLKDFKFEKAYEKARATRVQNSFFEVFEIADRPKATMMDVTRDTLMCQVRLQAATMANPSRKRRK